MDVELKNTLLAMAKQADRLCLLFLAIAVFMSGLSVYASRDVGGQLTALMLCVPVTQALWLTHANYQRAVKLRAEANRG